MKKKTNVAPELLLRRAEQLIHEYEMVEKQGTARDIPDGEMLLDLRNSISAVLIHLDSVGYKDTELYRSLDRRSPKFHRASYMARPKEILEEAKALLEKNRARYEYIYHAAAAKDMTILTIYINRVFEQAKIAEELMQTQDLTGFEEYRLALILTDLRKFIRQEKSKASIVARYKDTPRIVPEMKQVGQISMF